MRSFVVIAWFAVCLLLSVAEHASAAPKVFNDYVLKAVDHLARTRSGLGYANAAYTRNLDFGGEPLRATRPPVSMCVAAQIEIIVEALNMYAAETGDQSVYRFLPVFQWRSLRSRSFRGMVWISDNKASRGTGHALNTFGMGTEREFENLIPGDFVNLNRLKNKSGHAVVFLGYIDRAGVVLPQYGSNVVGFKYFSSQGSLQKGGFGYRNAYFDNVYCPTNEGPILRDCGVARSRTYLTAGQMFHPHDWDKSARDKAIALERKSPKGPVPPFDFKFFNGVTTDME
ncbi:hypothetical protein [Pseudorhodoferax soli]|uniref:Uncharacterized protein n=1 Tax=Pseudorhodoferax soli TaxID=545864 RepID=A0A368XWP6_9BURK|nr:hypothetical protein [Pseudorhodoferax soli]RCW72411.1 hypothetical protein DES41_10315 [Pseudorhodoferax soli]